MTTKAQKLRAKAESYEAKAETLHQEADALDKATLLSQPILQRMTFAAFDRCHCGAGMAYDPTAEEAPFKRPTKWQCSDIVSFAELSAERQAEVKAATHSPALPFAFYEVKSENQPSANGATTRRDDQRVSAPAA